MALPVYKPADKCTVYWDYENMAIPKQSNVKEILSKLKNKLWECIGSELRIEYQVYIHKTEITTQIQNDFNINGATLVHVPSTKPGAVDQQILTQMLLDLHDLEYDKKTHVIALVSGDKDFGNVLSQIRHRQPISKSFLILLNNAHIDSNLYNVVDDVIRLDCGKSKSKPKFKEITINIMHLLDRKNKFKHKTKSSASLNTIKSIICKTKKTSQLELFCKTKKGKQKQLMNHNDSLDKCGIADGQSIMWCKQNNKTLSKNKATQPGKKKKSKHSSNKKKSKKGSKKKKSKKSSKKKKSIKPGKKKRLRYDESSDNTPPRKRHKSSK
eukprot:204591_1